MKSKTVEKILREFEEVDFADAGDSEYAYTYFDYKKAAEKLIGVHNLELSELIYKVDEIMHSEETEGVRFDRWIELRNSFLLKAEGGRP